MGKLERKMKRLAAVREPLPVPKFMGLDMGSKPSVSEFTIVAPTPGARPWPARDELSYLIQDEAGDPSASVWLVDWAARRPTSLATEYPLPPSRPILELMQEAMALMDKPSWIERRESAWLSGTLRKSMIHYELAADLDAVERKPPNPRPWLDPAPQDYPPAAECSVAGELARLADGEAHNWHSPLRNELISDGLIEPVWRSNLWIGDKITTKGRARIRRG